MIFTWAILNLLGSLALSSLIFDKTFKSSLFQNPATAWSAYELAHALTNRMVKTLTEMNKRHGMHNLPSDQ